MSVSVGSFLVRVYRAMADGKSRCVQYAPFFGSGFCLSSSMCGRFPGRVLKNSVSNSSTVTTFWYGDRVNPRLSATCTSKTCGFAAGPRRMHQNTPFHSRPSSSSPPTSINHTTPNLRPSHQSDRTARNFCICSASVGNCAKIGSFANMFHETRLTRGQLVNN